MAAFISLINENKNINLIFYLDIVVNETLILIIYNYNEKVFIFRHFDAVNYVV